MKDARIYRIAMSFIPKINRIALFPIIERCGGFEALFKESPKAFNDLFKDAGIICPDINTSQILQNAERELEVMDLNGINITDCTCRNFPYLLTFCDDCPTVLFYKGELELHTEDSIYLGIVGTRKASDRYKELVSDVIDNLYMDGQRPIIVSGLAYGIDITAHRAAIKNGLKTYAVLGHGLNKVYPASHFDTAKQIASGNGALISEYPMSNNTWKLNFLERNRIVAGMCQGLIVAESALKGGSMTTAKISNTYGREIMTFPGRVGDIMSEGCNYMIKTNIASMIENAKDVEQILNLPEKRKGTQRRLNFKEIPEGNKRTIADLLKVNGEMNSNDISRATQLSMPVLLSILMEMELDEMVKSKPGGVYLFNNKLY